MEWDKVERVTRAQEVVLDPDPPGHANRGPLITYQYYTIQEAYDMEHKEIFSQIHKVKALQGDLWDHADERPKTKKNFKKVKRSKEDKASSLSSKIFFRYQ